MAPKFSANLGFLWTEMTLPDAIRAAARAGFDAVECHWPYDIAPPYVKQALDETGLVMLGLNTIRGDVGNGEMGLSALPGRETEAKDAIDQAIAYAVEIGTPNVHVMAGFAEGGAAHQTFVENLRYATDKAARHNITILIEPINHRDAPGYFLHTSDQAAQIIQQAISPNLKLMFDCYHLQIMEGNISNRLEEHLSIIGHIQIAAIPSRHEPDDGELSYPHIIRKLAELGYTEPLGAEYKPAGRVEDGLGWMSALRGA